MNNIFISLGIVIAFNCILFFPAYFIKTDYLTDLAYCISFVIVIVYNFINMACRNHITLLWKISSIPQKKPIPIGESTDSNTQLSILSYLLLTLVIIWALRLGVYLFIRILKIKKERRFNKFRSSFIKLLSFWIIQGVSSWVILLPISMVYYYSTNDVSINISFILGIIIFCIGFGTESIADYQKYKFKSKLINKQKWIEKGLWKRIRHPNYLGEILIWIGIYIICQAYLSPINRVIALISPLYIFVLLAFVSGVPILEKNADHKWSSNPGYLRYKSNSYKLIPFIY